MSTVNNLVSRRDAMLGLAGVVLADRLWTRVLAGTQPAGAKARSVIQIWLWGGPPHLDTFDPKPEAGYDYCGPLSKPIPTNGPGTRICELLPLLAKQADKYSLIRSMTHGSNSHETAAYMVQTGRPSGDRDVYPSAGAVVSLMKGCEAGYRGLLPPYIVLTELQGRFPEAGFLNARYKPFATGGDPAQKRFAVEGVVAQGITDQRQHLRRDLLEKLDTLSLALPGNPQLAAHQDVQKQAYDLILGDAGKVFDLSLEKDDLRDRYGRSTFGQSCLAARRLVQRGVPYVTINYKGWDTHKQNFPIMRRKLPELDKGLATLLEDLSSRGLLSSTLIWCCGEFGRTPKVQWEAPWNGGRGHYCRAFSVLVAGGGFKGGRIVGSSDAKGEEVRDRPVYPCDLLGSIYELSGIDTGARLPHPQGLAAHVVPAADEHAPSGGLLKEIM
jgi:hypothetical protein